MTDPRRRPRRVMFSMSRFSAAYSSYFTGYRNGIRVFTDRGIAGTARLSLLDVRMGSNNDPGLRFFYRPLSGSLRSNRRLLFYNYYLTALTMFHPGGSFSASLRRLVFILSILILWAVRYTLAERPLDEFRLGFFGVL
jgi:hypothetical protein